MKSRALLTIVLVLCSAVSSTFGCYTVVVGKDASVDGSVLVGHNEENTGDRFLNFRRIPSLKHSAGAVVDVEGQCEQK